MKLKLSRREAETTESSNEVQPMSNLFNAKENHEQSTSREALPEHKTLLKPDISSTQLRVSRLDVGNPNRMLPGLMGHVTPPPSPISEDPVDKELCGLVAKGPPVPHPNLSRPFLSPATTDEEDLDSARPPIGQDAAKQEQELQNRKVEVLGIDEAANGDTSRKGDIFRCSFCERTFSYLCHLKVHERVSAADFRAANRLLNAT